MLTNEVNMKLQFINQQSPLLKILFLEVTQFVWGSAEAFLSRVIGKIRKKKNQSCRVFSISSGTKCHTDTSYNHQFFQPSDAENQSRMNSFTKNR